MTLYLYKNLVYKSVRQHQSTSLREWETWVLWMNVSTEWEWSFINEMCSLWAWQSEWVHTPSSHLTACGHASVTAFTWGCTIWFEPPMTQMSSCHICLNSDSVFSNPAQLNLNQLAPLKNPPCIQSIICIMYVHGGLISRLCEHASTSALLRIGSRSRFCCVCGVGLGE